MPKMKTHRGAAKRFRVTGSGKIMRRRAFRTKHLETKPSTRMRRLSDEVVVSPADTKEVRKLLGR